jgi:hypothetical protein
MKKLIIALFSMVLIACAAAPIQNPVCPKENSWICEQSAKTNIQPETVYGWIYNSTAIAALSNIIEIQDACNFEKQIADWYVSVYPVSYNSVIKEVVSRIGLIKDPKKAALVTSLVNKNLNLYANSALISPADDEILRKGHAAFVRDFGCS